MANLLFSDIGKDYTIKVTIQRMCIAKEAYDFFEKLSVFPVHVHGVLFPIVLYIMSFRFVSVGSYTSVAYVIKNR